ncbi:S-protein homolog 23 [Arabidopsis lyrata subsp. lyrata]|nr:S-protein homolog 23 [Arabidopsis lyrata subsp. lyrata]|eukprot:XP_020882046.1 S-protein homolog 23 [Arabidopsis lyrata subsp. lyrata]
MKNLSIFLFVCSLCLLGHVSSAGIRIGNELKNKKLLWMRCYSKDDVIGPKIIPIGGHSFNYFVLQMMAAYGIGEQEKMESI